MLQKSAYSVFAGAALILACGSSPEHSPRLAAEQVAPSPLSAEDSARYGTEVVQNLERVRAVTVQFQDISAAHSAGYPRAVPHCLDNLPEGGMGLHYMHQGLVDTKLDVEHPEILVYAPTGGDKPKLVGVEYIVPLSQWTASEPPSIFGRSLKRSEGLGLWYLHVWAWERNRNGLFADWNPAVKC